MLDLTLPMRLLGWRRRRRLARLDPAAVQQRQLLSMLARASRTRFGRDHGFAAIRDISEFRRRVPLRGYDAFRARYWGDDFPVLRDVSWPGTIPWFALSSGTTTGRTKHIPLTGAMVDSNMRAGLDLIAFHLAARPKSRIIGGKSFMLGGSTTLTEEAPGVASGDLSGIIAANVPRWYAPRIFPPRDLALVADWEEKIARLAEAVADEDIRNIAGTPSWLLLFFDKIAEVRGDAAPDLAKYFPNLELLVHGGVDFTPYRHRFEALLADNHAELREVYPASEGFFAVADRGPGEGLRLMLDTGIFYEFVPVDELDADRPTRHWAGTVHTGINYAIVVSTCAGLWAYVVGDTVEFVDLDPLRVRVTGRTSYTLSAFGEHLIAAEIEEAVGAAAAAIEADVTDWSVGALIPANGDARGGHLYIVEFAGGVVEDRRLARFAEALDRALCAANKDYETHRGGGFGMKPPEVRAVPAGTFVAWMRKRGQLGGQHKVPRIVNDTGLFDDLRAFARQACEAGAPPSEGGTTT